MRFRGVWSLSATFLFLGCFSEPSSTGGEASDDTTSGGTTATATTATSDVTSSTAMPTTEPGDSSSTGGGSSSSSEGPGDVATGEPPESFCVTQRMDNLLACEDFSDNGSGHGWSEGPNIGFERVVVEDAVALEGPSVRLNSLGFSRTPTQGLYLADDPVVLEGTGDVVEASFAVSLPPDFVAICEAAPPVRVFEIQYGDEDTVAGNVVIAIGPQGLTGYLFVDGAFNDVLFEDEGIPMLPSAGWRVVRVQLERVDTGYRLGRADMNNDLVPYDLPAFAPPGGVVRVNVGPWFEGGATPPLGCGYTVDNLVLRDLSGP